MLLLRGQWLSGFPLLCLGPLEGGEGEAEDARHPLPRNLVKLVQEEAMRGCVNSSQDIDEFGDGEA